MKLEYHIQSDRVHTIAYTFFRVLSGLLLMINGWSKWLALPDASLDFPDPLGIGSTLSIYLAIFSELICGLALVLGLMTRIASIPIVITFVVAVFLVHGNDPFDVKQTAMLYLIASLYIIVKGSGRFSLDELIKSLDKGRTAQ